MSTVLYAELIRWDGTKLAGSKVRINGEFASGYLGIPEHIKSGIYYLRVYTRWMRNYSPYAYCYLPVKIVNPHTREADPGPETVIPDIRIEKGKVTKITDAIVVSGLKSDYGPRERVEFDLSVIDDQFSGPYCISITRRGSIDIENSSRSFLVQNDTAKENRLEYLPENAYLSLAGKMLDRQSKEPLASEQLILTSTLDPFYYAVNTADSEGRFLFLLPDIEGSHQFCLTAPGKDSSGVEFLVSNDFCRQAVSLPYLPFELAPEEREEAREIASNAQLHLKFFPPGPVNEPNENFYPFYGKASEIIYIKDYIELLDLREFFFELVSNVSVDKIKGQWQLRLIESGSFSVLPPLLLLDNIPVSNNEKLLKLSTREIERIEVINGGYIIGKTLYSGIISIFTNKGDLAGMTLNNNYQYFDYQLLQQRDHPSPSYNGLNPARTAEMLNLLYWRPNLEISGKESVKISFYTSDALGEYAVTLRSIGGKDSTVVFSQTVFTVD